MWVGGLAWLQWATRDPLPKMIPGLGLANSCSPARLQGIPGSNPGRPTINSNMRCYFVNSRNPYVLNTQKFVQCRINHLSVSDLRVVLLEKSHYQNTQDKL